MQPTKHMDPSEEELIAHIRESLMSHEESYVPGAWEKFNNEGNKERRPFFWIGPLSSAAAVLLITAGLYFFINRSSDKEHLKLSADNKAIDKGQITTTAEQDTSQEPINNITTPARSAHLKRSTVSDHYIAAIRGGQTQKRTSADAISETAGLAVSGENIVKPGQAKESPVTGPAVVNNENIVRTDNKPKPEGKSTDFQEFLKKEVIASNNKAGSAAAGIENKWEMGVVVAPSFGSTKKLNMGYGVSMGYAVSDRISLGSGISYNELTASRNVMNGAEMSSGSYIAADAKNLESVETRVVGIDVPLELKYHFSKSLYANVGVSAFAVLNQRQNNNYIQEKLVQNADSPVNGENDYNSFVVKQKTTEEAPKSDVNQDKYLGFYNFSFGYKQKISKANSVSIEPFMKIPMKEVSKENLRLMGTGVRLKFDF